MTEPSPSGSSANTPLCSSNTETSLGPQISTSLPYPRPAQDEEIAELILPPRQKFKDPSWMTKNAGKRIRLIAHWEVETTTKPVTSTDGYEFLCSYSWKQAAIPTIYVPGTPPRWSPPLLPKQLELDKGAHWCDQHGHRVPRHQFEPVFQALAGMNPTVSFSDVDIVVNRNTLLKLYDFASFKRGKAFHVDLDMVRNTLFIGRKESKAKTTQHSGYGRNFEAEFTTEDHTLPQAEGHHRVIRYNLGALNIVVRIEADAYLPSSIAENDGSPNEFFRNILGTTATATISHHSPRPTIALAQGTLVPHNSTLELKSNSSKSVAMPQLWFGRTPYICCAKHTPGSAGAIQAAEVVRLKQEDFEDWDKRNQRHLRRLAWFLEELRGAARQAGGKAVLVMIEKGAPVQVFEREGRFGALPEEIVERFWS